MSEAPNSASVEASWTCGMGLAQHSAVPAKMAEFLKGLTEVLDTHIPTIHTGDASGRLEGDAYGYLSGEFAAIAMHLERTAARMRGYRDLPAARHHEEALADPALMEPFRRFVEIETELAELLTTAAREDAELLAQLDG